MAEKATPSARPIWTGSISFGLVTIPVKLYTAIREKRLHFRSLHDQDKVPLKQKMYCPADGKEVHAEHIVKGFEIEKDRFVIVRQEELEAVAPKRTKAIEIMDFVQFEEIDPLFFDRPYHVVPKPEGAKPYKLLLEAMIKSKRVAVANVVMWSRQYLCALRPLDGELCLETLHFSDEIVPAGDVPGPEVEKTKIDDREMKIAQQLIESLSTKFKPEKYRDEYREAVMEMVRRKAEGEEVVVRADEDDVPTKGKDLIAALEASLARSRGPGTTVAARSARRSRKQDAR